MPSSTRMKTPPADAAPVEAPLPPEPPHVRRYALWVIYAAIILGPTLFLPLGTLIYNPLETPRKLALYLCAWLLGGLILWSWSLRGRLVWRRHALDLPVGLYALACLLTGLSSAYPYLAFFAPLWSADSLLLTSIGILLYLGVKEFIRTPEEIEGALLALVLTGGALAALGLGEYFLAHYFGRPVMALGTPALFGFNVNFAGLRLNSTLGNPMFAGTYFAMLIPLGVGVAQVVTRRLPRALCIAAVLLMAPALLLTQARAAWIGLFFTIPVVLLYIRAAFPRLLPTVSRKVWGLVGVGVLLLVIIALVQPAIRARLVSVVRFGDSTVKTRVVYMQTAWRMFLVRPVQGWGTGNLGTIFPQFRPSSQVIEMSAPLNRGYSSALPHNLVLQTAACMGLLGVIPLVWLFLVLYRSGHALLRGEPRRAWTAIGLLGLATTYLITNQFAFDSAETMALFWIVLGLLAALTAEEHARPAPLAAGWVATFRIAALVVVIGAALHTAMEAGAACLIESGTRKLTQAANSNDLNLLKTSIQEMKLSLPLTLSIDRTGIRTGDVMPYEALCIAYKNYIGMARDQEGFEQANTEFLKAAKNALHLNARAPRALRFLTMVYTQQGELDKAIATGNQLTFFEPHSSEAFLISSDAYVARGSALAHDRLYADALVDMQKAEMTARTAATLDPTYAPAWAKLAFVQSCEVIELPGNPQTARLVSEICDNYRRALERGITLDPEDRLRYTVNLFLLDMVEGGANHRWEEAVEQGRHLQRERNFIEMLSRVKVIYKKQPALWQKTLAALQDPPRTPMVAPARRPAIPRF